MPNGDERYEDDHYVEEHMFSAMIPDHYYFLIRHKESRNMFRVLAKDRNELAQKVEVGDWEPDPSNQPEPDEEEEEA